MKIKPIATALLLALAATGAAQAGAAGTANAPAAAPATANAPDYASDLRDILYGLPFYEGMAYAKIPANESYGRAMRDHFARQVSKQDFTDRMLPGMADIVAPALAAQVAAYTREPAYRKRLQALVAEWSGASERPAPLTAEEQALLKRLDNGPASREFAELMPKVSELVRRTMASTREELEVKLARQALATIELTQAEIEQVNKTGRPVEIRTIGFEPWDQIIRAVGNSTLKMALTFHRFNSGLDGMGYAELVKASSVVKRQNYAEAAALVDQAEDGLAQALQELDAAIKEREQQIGKSDFASQSKFRSKLDEVTAGLYTFAGDLGEAYRRMFGAQRQMVVFLRERDGQAKVEGEKILFEDDANVAVMNEIFQRIAAAANDVQAIVDRQTAHEDAELGKLRTRLQKPGK